MFRLPCVHNAHALPLWLRSGQGWGLGWLSSRQAFLEAHSLWSALGRHQWEGQVKWFAAGSPRGSRIICPNDFLAGVSWQVTQGLVCDRSSLLRVTQALESLCWVQLLLNLERLPLLCMQHYSECTQFPIAVMEIIAGSSVSEAVRKRSQTLPSFSGLYPEAKVTVEF